MVKKPGLVLLVIVLMVSMLIGCAKPAPAPAPTPPAPEAITWRFITLQSPTNPMIVEVQKGLDAVTERSQGRLKFEGHYGMESGFKSKEYINVLEQGMTDVAVVATTIVAFDYPWQAVNGIPFLCPDHAVRQKMLNAQKPMLDEFYKEHGIIVLANFLHIDPWAVVYSTRNIRSLADFEGMLIRCYDPGTIAFAEGVGATPTFLEKGEVYLALQKGTIDGAMTGTTSAEAQHFDEVSPYEVKLWPMFLPNIVGVSKVAWDKLPEDLQQILLDTFKEWEKDYWAIVNDPAQWEGAFDYAVEHGMTIIDPPPDVKAAFPSISESATEAFLAESGEEGKRILALIEAALAEAGY